jgi:hypothetical protein
MPILAYSKCRVKGRNPWDALVCPSAPSHFPRHPWSADRRKGSLSLIPTGSNRNDKASGSAYERQ